MTGRNVIILGETGVGKSSIINMICGDNTAITSSKAKGCTLKAEPYKDKSGNTYFDTAGFNEPKEGAVDSAKAIRNLANLLHDLNGSVNFLIFVIRQGRITDTMVKNYKIFVEYICEKKVPVVLAITGCELECFEKSDDDSDNSWYNENKESFDESGLKFCKVVSGCFTNDVSNKKGGAAKLITAAYKNTKESMDLVLTSPEFENPKSFGSAKSWLQRVVAVIFSPISWWFNWTPISNSQAMINELVEKHNLSVDEAAEIANKFVK